MNDIDDCVESSTRKFADDTKVAKIVEVEEDSAAQQKDIDLMMRWAETWGMVFNVEKCKVMHVGHQNLKHQYRMGDVRLAEVAEEKDLGVWTGNDLKPTNQFEQPLPHQVNPGAAVQDVCQAQA